MVVLYDRDGTKFAVLDHVPSSHGIILPIKVTFEVSVHVHIHLSYISVLQELVDICHLK